MVNMGDVNSAMIFGCLAGIEATTTEHGIPTGRDEA